LRLYKRDVSVGELLLDIESLHNAFFVRKFQWKDLDSS